MGKVLAFPLVRAESEGLEAQEETGRRVRRGMPAAPQLEADVAVTRKRRKAMVEPPDGAA